MQDLQHAIYEKLKSLRRVLETKTHDWKFIQAE